jgi:cystathionine beta-lyase
VERQTYNAVRIAEFLAGHNSVRNVNYPGLPEFSGHETAKAQMKDFGAMLSFELDKGVPHSGFMHKLQIIYPAVSLGGVETLVCVPAETSHAKISEEERRRVGISDALLRLSVGIENADDLIDDLNQAFKDP